jgi:hypothetical protein
MEKIKIFPAELLEPYQSGKKLTILVANILICLMMTCVGSGFAFLGARLIPGWQGGYLVWLSLFLSIESIYSRKRAERFEQREKILFRVSEWIAFAVLIKILLYLMNGTGQFFKDILLWQTDFIANFFTGEYFLALVVAILTWWSSAAFSAEVEQLYEREKDAEWDDLGKLQNVLKDMRNKLSSRVFLIGTLLVGLAVMSRLETDFILIHTGLEQKNIFPVVIVLTYFFLALVLLTQSQFALLRTRWITQRLAVSPNLARNWIRYGLLFFCSLAVVVFFLPTNYSIGLLDTLKYALSYFFQAASFLILLITLPITYCLSLFSLTSKTPNTPPATGPSAMPSPPAPGQSPAWWEFIRSLAFWIFFVGIIVFALRYYLVQNTELWNIIRHFRLVRWIAEVIQTVRVWLRGKKRQIDGLVNAGLKRLRAQRVNLPTAPLRRLFNLTRMNTREKVIFYYLSLIHLGGERGLERTPAQTPYQYQQALSQVVPEVNNELDGLTGTFVEARYSQHPIAEQNATKAGAFWERIKAVLHAWQKPKDN